MVNIIIVCLVSYLIGSIPTAFILGKLLMNIDIREHGSGNVGATNVFRVIGKKWGIIALIIDIFKGIVPVILLTPFIEDKFEIVLYAKFLIGFFAIAGHNWTIFLKFKGGKGVATTAGIVCAIFPKAFLIAFALFFVVVFITRYVSLGSILASLVFPLNLFVFYKNMPGFKVALIVSCVLALLIVFRHKANIIRLIKKEEKKIL